MTFRGYVIKDPMCRIGEPLDCIMPVEDCHGEQFGCAVPVWKHVLSSWNVGLLQWACIIGWMLEVVVLSVLLVALALRMMQKCYCWLLLLRRFCQRVRRRKVAAQEGEEDREVDAKLRELRSPMDKLCACVKPFWLKPFRCKSSC